MQLQNTPSVVCRKYTAEGVFYVKKECGKKKRTRGLWTGLFLLAVSAGFVVWCGLWGLARFLPPARVPSSSLRADLPQSAVPYSRQEPEALSPSVPVYLQNPELPGWVRGHLCRHAAGCVRL